MRYCLADKLLKTKRLKSNKSQFGHNEKIGFRFHPLPTQLCFIADCMYPGKPVNRDFFS